MSETATRRGVRFHRGLLLRGVSTVALLTALGASHASAQLAQLRAVTGAATAAAIANATAHPGQSLNNTAGMSAAQQRAVAYQMQVSQSISLATQAQTAARAAAQALNPNVPDGLGIGGLEPVANPVPAAQDPTGLNTWEGASAPTQTTSSGNTQVTINQTQSRAILSWDTFNVGAHTTLTFNQKQNGVAQPSWVALNRVVGQLDPITGLRDPNSAPAPSQILGAIKADGTVLVLNQNGILFSATSQINVNSLIATSLEIGRALDNGTTPLTIKDRNDTFLNYGLLGYADQASATQLPSAFTFSAQAVSTTAYDPMLEGAIEVDAGAQITSNTGGFILLAGPKVTNAGDLSSPQGEVALQSGREITLQRSDGSTSGANPNVRGFVLTSLNRTDAAGNYAENTGIIEASEGFVSLASTDTGAVINDGILEATTSVSRNGFIQLYGGDIQLGQGSTIAITPEDSKETIPQDPTSLEDFKPSDIDIGSTQSRIEIQQNAMIYAPSGNVTIGADAGPTTTQDSLAPGASRIFIDTGATIDVAGLPDVLIPASRNSILIRPVTANDLQDAPNYKDGFLNGAAVYVDPRISGVRADGVAWVGSPLIPAQSYAEQVGVTVQELMTPGGNITLGVSSYSGQTMAPAPDVTVKSGATIDMSGGWVTYQAGMVQTTELIDAGGEVVNIADADPNDTFIGIYNGFTTSQPRWGISQTFVNPVFSGAQYEGSYTEGRDAGSLTIKGSAAVLDGTIYANAYAGPLQIVDAEPGTVHSSIPGDLRLTQASPSQLPAGGMLFVQALGTDVNGILTGGGDIDIVNQSDYEPVSSDLGYGQSISLDSNGNLIVPLRDPASLLPPERQQAITLSADALSNMGLSEISLETSGEVNVAQDATVNLDPGGVFNAEAGRTITVDGVISAASGTINLKTVNLGFGSVFVPEAPQLGSFDVVVNGTLSTRGRWVNDFGAGADQIEGSAYLNGGNINLYVAPRVALDPTTGLLASGTASVSDTLKGKAPEQTQDISGSILINDGALLDVSSGGYVTSKGTFVLSAKGGNISLIDETTYFQLTDDATKAAGGLPGFRVTTITPSGSSTAVIPVNPDTINARVAIADGTILANGFGGGGTFTLTTPQFQFGDDIAATGTELPMDFFSRAGFANYNITSYKTDLLPNAFDNGLGGYNAVLATQVLDVGAGQTLSLTQSMFSPLLNDAQVTALRGLATGGDLYSVLTPGVPTDAWDRKAVNLTLGGLMELHVEQGGQVLGEAGGTLTVSQLDNEGTVRIPGGTITQSETLPALYVSNTAEAVNDLSQIFTVNDDGTIDEKALNALGIPNPSNPKKLLTNAQVAAGYPIYLLGDLGADEGVYLAPGSVTDLSGESILNPRATIPGYAGSVVTGRMVSGGTLASVGTQQLSGGLFQQTIGISIYKSEDPTGVITAAQVVAAPQSTLDLQGASDSYDALLPGSGFGPTPVWSNGGTLSLGNGGTLTGATINAAGGAPTALGGTLVVLDPILTQTDPDAPTQNVISASMITGSGFDTLVAEGSITSIGDVTLDLGRGFFLTSRPFGGTAGQDLNDTSTRDTFVPTISSGGALEIDAPYISFASDFQSVSTPEIGTPGTNSATFKADEIDIAGAVVFDQSIANVTLDATGDVRLIGVEPWQQNLGIGGNTVANSLAGQLAVNGDLNITAAQVYPTTGSTFYVTSAAADGTITFAKSDGPTPATPYSAGGNLLIQAANIVQGGVIRVPIGSLTLGANDPLLLTTDSTTNQFAPATQSVQVLDGSITSVSANGLSVPYGTTTDQKEWFFAPTGSDELTAPPQAVLHFGGTDVSLNAGATVDVSGGGDLYAYEFIPGTGGSHDVLSQLNTDPFSGNNGYQYPDGRQVYAIVPGLSNAAAAAYDPIYSSNYGNLYSANAAGQSVYLSAAPGLAAGWYTLLPAQYAMLPGGMRVVEQTGAAAIAPGSSNTLKDGTLVVAGYYGTADTGTYQSTIRTFDVQPQDVFLQYSEIALTSANQKFAADAAANGDVAPRLPVDAGRLVLAPSETLAIDATLLTTPGAGGRGSEADISGQLFDIVSTLPDTLPTDGTIVLTADSLTNLNAASILIGGTRTDNADGTTSLDITAQTITVENDSAHPLTAPEIVLAVDGSSANITLADGAAIIASGASSDNRSGDYIIDGSLGNITGEGAVLRVAMGPQRQVTRLNPDSGALPGMLDIGASTLQGASVLLDSSGDLSVAPTATITADALALSANKVTFVNGTTDVSGLSGLIITPELQTLFGEAKELSIRTPNDIAFSSGTYQFADLDLDTPGISLLDGSSVTLNTGVLTLANSSADMGACDTVGPACGSGSLAINASEIDFNSGTLHTYGFGANTTLSAAGGMFFDGIGVFDAGPAELDLETPYLGDRALTLAPGEAALLPSLSLTTTGAVNITNPTAAAIPTTSGTPGASLSIGGNSVSVTDTDVRATAGSLSITSATGIAVSGNAILETPGYAKTLGDSADPVTVSAPGGLLKLTALNGDIDLGTGTKLSVGGGAGDAGTLDLSASKGNVAFGGTLDADAPGGGGSFILDTGGSFDLSAFDADTAKEFTGDIAIRTGSGDLTLAAGDTLTANNVSLTADDGLVDIAGTINVSGTNGGEVDLYGLSGVTLESTTLIDAHANGYASTDTRRASGGTVNIGTDGAGIITVASGAVIDVSAHNTGDRLVPMVHNGTTYYTYVEGDQGGVVDFRAPVIEQSGGDTVNVNYAGTIDGASSIVLEGFKHFDLSQIVADPDFTGVTINAQGQAVLDAGASAAGKENFLADNATGTLVNFVQDFDVSASYGQLGGLASQANFHARPGMELDYSGDIVLASNWNLGAGTVDVAGAVAAGLMAPVPSLPGQYYVLPGDEAAVFENYTKLTYRVGGAVDGEPGVLTLRAGGNLDLQGSITDGFFQFRDQTDPGYLNLALGGGDAVYSPTISPNCFGGSCSSVVDWQAGDPGSTGPYISISIPSSSALQGQLQNPAPYSAAANSPAAFGSLPGGTGDPLGSAQMFPLINGNEAVNSWSYNLVGGADLGSVDPTRTAPGATGNVIVEGTHPYTFAAVKGTSAFDDTLLLRAGAEFVTADQWYQAFTAQNPTLDPNSFTFVNFSTAPANVKSFLTSEAASYFAQYPGQFELVGPAGAPTGVTTTLALASKFMSDVVSANFASLLPNYKPPKSSAFTKPTTATAPTLVRTGTGNINVAAAGDIDLRNGATPTYEKITGGTATPQQGGVQLGGTAIYTAGHLADPTPRTVVDALSGQSFTLDPSAYDVTSNVFANSVAYQYGGGSGPDAPGVGYTGILIANPVYAEGGGDVSLNAGEDVLGRRDVWQEAGLGTYYNITSSYGYSWIGTAEQPWRTGTIGDVTNVLVNPQLFQEGVGALGGGNITVNAGRDVSDLSIVSDTSITTADVSSSATATTQALWTFGGGNVSVNAGRDLLGGRIDVASGSATVDAGADVENAGDIQMAAFGPLTPNELRLRVSDATIAVDALGTVDVQGIAALGVEQSASQVQNNLNARGFYSADSGVTILADSTVTVDNQGADVVTPSEGATLYTFSAVYPGSFGATSITGNLDLVTEPATSNVADAIILFPSPTGQLNLFAAGDISPVTLAMEDGDPGLLPGVFSTFTADASGGVLSGRTFLFPGVLPNTPQVERAALHNSDITHLNDPNPVRIDAGGDIVDMIVSVPKQARISAGRDIVNMMFFGQNVQASDITRVVAGRDITATTTLVQPLIALPNTFGAPLAALQGNAFVLGGPGSFFLEAGRNAGPFLNSANTDGFTNVVSTATPEGEQSYGGGILSVGNEWNPWLPTTGASLYVEFGVGKGADYDAFRNYYLDPANLANLDGSLFVQVKDAAGDLVPDRSQPIYGPILIGWMQQNAAAQLVAAYGTTSVTYAQAYTAFAALPELQQRIFILDNVYFNELEQTSIPTGPSYKQYSRGYRAVNTLFPASLGYTQNDLSGGGNGANQLEQTGDLDLRLAAIETTRGGNIYILGPGGRVLAGSTVATADQAARHAYIGGSLFSGNVNNEPLASAITSIPAGFEGILTLRGGSIDTFTDEDFLLNQSRLFTEDGGDIEMWSSNGSLNAGQGPKTSANFPPIVVQVDEDLFSQVDSVGGVTGAGIAAFESDPDVTPPDVFLIAPRGTVDAGAAGVRVAGNLFIAALTVANASNFSVGGTSFGIPAAASVAIGTQTSASSASAAAAQAAQSVASAARSALNDLSVIIVDVLGYVGGDDNSEDDKRRKKKK